MELHLHRQEGAAREVSVEKLCASCASGLAGGMTDNSIDVARHPGKEGTSSFQAFHSTLDYFCVA